MSPGVSTQVQTAPDILVERRADAAWVTLNRPGAMNALSRGLVAALAAAIRGLRGEPGVRAVVITGAGAKAFCAGADLKERRSMSLDDTRQFLDELGGALEAIARFPAPVIAALNGVAFGGGLELALACDLRLAADGIRLGMPPAKLGLVYSHTGLRRFIDIIGVARTRELFLLGRNIEARTALGWGLVNEVVIGTDVEETALSWAAEMAANAPLSVQGNKRVIRELLRAEGELDPDVERELIALREACFASEDMQEGVRAFGEKRPARWKGR
jgi:enoyl-CoA hydratase/carnithine racemase